MLTLSHHRHSGRLQSHEHTSYLPLMLALMVVGVILGAFTASAQSPGPEAGSVGLTGVVEGKPPSSGATIDSPTNGSRFGESPITISGTCPKDTLIEVYKNDIFAGSTLCSSNGTYSFQIDLLFGENRLQARVYDALSQAGPDSNIVTITYDGLPSQPSPLGSLDFTGDQLLLNTDSVFRGTFPTESLSVPLSIIGGTPPFAVNIQWGDADNSVISRDSNVTFDAEHTYNRAGTYQVGIQATDSVGRVAFLTVATIVNGIPGGATTAATATTSLPPLLAIWPIYVGLVAVVGSFWLGEIREKRVIAKRGPIYH